MPSQPRLDQLAKVLQASETDLLRMAGLITEEDGDKIADDDPLLDAVMLGPWNRPSLESAPYEVTSKNRADFRRS